MYFCNLNAIFTPVFLKITLIPHLLMFWRIRRKIKQSDGRNQVKRKLMSCSLPWRRGSPLRRKGFATMTPKKAKLMPWVRRSEDTLCHSEAILRRSEGSIDQKTALGFAKAKDDGLDQQTTIFDPIISPFSITYK